MARTKIADMINPQVMADMVSAGLAEALKFAPLASVGRTLQGRPGNTLSLPKFAFIGEASDVAEGVAMDVTKMASTSTTVTVKKAGKGVEITDESILSGYGDPIGEAEKQLQKAIARKIDSDVMAAAATATLVSGTGLVEFNGTSVADALVYFGEDIDEPMVALIAPAQLAGLRKDPDFIAAVPEMLMTGVVGSVLGCQIVVSAKIVAADSKFTNYIVKPGAFAIEMKRDAEVETDRDILAKTTVITVDQHYVAYLADDSKVIKMVTKQ